MIRKLWLKWLYRDFTGVVDVGGRSFIVDLQDSLRIHRNGTYAPGSLRFLLEQVSPDDVVVDVGAAWGWFTVHLARVAKHVFAYEPDVELWSKCMANIESNSITNVSVFFKAVLPVSLGHTTLLYRDPDNQTGGRMFAGGSRKAYMRVPVGDLNQICKIDVLKIDAGGMDYAILRSLDKWPRVVLCEWNEAAHEEYGAGGVDGFTGLGSYYHLLKSKGKVYQVVDYPPTLRLLNDYPDSESCDLLVIREDKEDA